MDILRTFDGLVADLQLMDDAGESHSDIARYVMSQCATAFFADLEELHKEVVVRGPAPNQEFKKCEKCSSLVMTAEDPFRYVRWPCETADIIVKIKGLVNRL